MGEAARNSDSTSADAHGYELVIAAIWWVGLQATVKVLVLVLVHAHGEWAGLQAHNCSNMVGGGTSSHRSTSASTRTRT